MLLTLSHPCLSLCTLRGGERREEERDKEEPSWFWFSGPSGGPSDTARPLQRELELCARPFHFGLESGSFLQIIFDLIIKTLSGPIYTRQQFFSQIRAGKYR